MNKNTKTVTIPTSIPKPDIKDNPRPTRTPENPNTTKPTK